MIQIILENWLLIATIILAIYELIARKIPTTGNWSLIHLIVQILDIIVKNKSKLNDDEKTERNFTISRVRKRKSEAI